jgi:hypothetical protein
MLPQADPCPFCGEEMKWRKDKWIHQGRRGCIMIGIGLETKRQVSLWNTRDGVEPADCEDYVLPPFVKPPPPPPVENWLTSFRKYHTQKPHP